MRNMCHQKKNISKETGSIKKNQVEGPRGKMAAALECNVVTAASEPELLYDKEAKRYVS